MLRLVAGQAETFWDEALPIEVRQLPADLAALDGLLSDPVLLAPFSACWEREAVATGVSAAGHGRPTIAIETYARLMVLKQRHGWGYRTLVAEVSDSIHLRRFCLIALSELAPDESTVRKLTKRVGEQTVNEIIRTLIESAVREKRFRARAVRIDSTVIEADIKYPTDAGLAAHGVKSLAREGRKLARAIGQAGVGPRLKSSVEASGRCAARGCEVVAVLVLDDEDYFLTERGATSAASAPEVWRPIAAPGRPLSSGGCCIGPGTPSPRPESPGGQPAAREPDGLASHASWHRYASQVVRRAVKQQRRLTAPGTPPAAVGLNLGPASPTTSHARATGILTTSLETTSKSHVRVGACEDRGPWLVPS